MRPTGSVWILLLCSGIVLGTYIHSAGQDRVFENSILGDASPLSDSGDLAATMIDGIDRFLLRKIDQIFDLRTRQWPIPDAMQAVSNEIASVYELQLEPLRARLRSILGMKDERIQDVALTTVAFPGDSLPFASSVTWHANLAQWQVFPGVQAEGLLVTPKNKQPRFCFVLIPDANQTPEDLLKEPSTLELANQGGLILIPSVVQRTREARNGRTVMSDQEYIYRSAFVLGRHLAGYQVQETLAAIDYCRSHYPKLKVFVGGYAEGGWIALFAAAIDERINGVVVSGHFGSKSKLWNEPLHRNLFGLLNEFGDAELVAMVAPRSVWIDSSPGPSITITGKNESPAVLDGPSEDTARKEFDRAIAFLKPWGFQTSLHWNQPPSDASTGISKQVVQAWLAENYSPVEVSSVSLASQINSAGVEMLNWTQPERRRQRSLQKWDRWNQHLLTIVEQERNRFWSQLDTSSLQKFGATIEPFRTIFRNEIIGSWDEPKSPLNPRVRLVYDAAEEWQGYEIVLDVFPDIIAYGVLLLPRDLKPDSKRPCVVFQHGLEGRPKDVIEGDHPAYHDVAVQLVKQGYVVFAPQNPYLFGDRFRTLQRKSNLIGRTLFSTIVAQHEQIVSWLGSLPVVDEKKIAFYGLSYGGKSAMRIPALVDGYCLSICSADFNDWVWKNSSTDSNYSYVWTNEYEIFEFDLGPKFNYAEMAALIAPRPFMVERGHRDNVAPDERVGLEYAKVQNLYAARLGLPNRTRIEWFVGPHTINGKGTFQFLAENLLAK